MKFLNASTSQIDKLVDPGASRWSIGNVYFSAERGHMCATNGHALAVVHVVPEEGDTTGWITIEALQVWRKVQAKAGTYLQQACKLECRPEVLIVTGSDGGQQIFKRPSYTPGSFPNYDAVFPAEGTVTDVPAFTLNINLLKKLVDALGGVDTLNGKSDMMVAVFPSKDNRSAHLVKTSTHGPIGIIMPVKAPDEASGWLTTLAAVDEHFAMERNAANLRSKAQADQDARDAAAMDEELPDCELCQNTGRDEDGNLCDCGRAVAEDGTVVEDDDEVSDEDRQSPEPEPEPEEAIHVAKKPRKGRSKKEPVAA